MTIVKGLFDWTVRGFFITILSLMILDTVGCRTTRTDRFEDVSSRICDRVEQYAGLAGAIGAEVVPDGVPQLVLELGLEEAKHRCEQFRRRTE